MTILDIYAGLLIHMNGGGIGPWLLRNWGWSLTFTVLVGAGRKALSRGSTMIGSKSRPLSVVFLSMKLLIENHQG